MATATTPRSGSSAPSLFGHRPALPPLAVYVHFPWCLAKCPYCDFVSFEKPRDAIDHEGYANAVLAELEARAHVLERYAVRTIFFGGGTPSLWEPAALGRVLAAIVARAGSAPEEITAECNPSSLSPERSQQLVAEGINRLSVGVQSLDAERLAFLGRLHDPAGAMRALEGALATGARVSADLIYGVATERGFETPEQAAREAATLAALGLGHLSAYALTIEPNTAFGALARKNRLPMIEDDVVAASFDAVAEAVAPYGLSRYETSNFAVAGQHAQHNLAYWLGHDYLGLGCAAYGTLSEPDGFAVRYRNPPNVDRYLARARQGRFDPHEREALTPETRLRERIMLGLRLSEGLDLDRASADLAIDPWSAERLAAIERLVSRGRLERVGSRLVVPPAGRLYADGTAAELF